MAISSVLGSSALLPAGLGFRNVLINGAMNVAQRSTSVASISTGDSNYHTVDRWITGIGSAGTWTQTQSTDAPPGFGNSLKMQCTTANTSLAAGAYLILGQNIEGLNLQQFSKGTSSAKPFSLSFWVKAFQTGTYIAELYDSINARQVTKTYTINASGTWEYKTIQFPADAIGAFANSNASACSLYFWFASGTANTSGTASGSWATEVSANRAAGLNVNSASSTNNYFQFTGVQLEQNYQPTPFEQRPIGVELSLCQRYYYRTDTGGTNAAFRTLCSSFANTTTVWQGVVKFPVRMRVAPSAIEEYGNKRLVDYQNGFAVTSITIDTPRTSTDYGCVGATVASGLTAFRPYDLEANNSTTAALAWSAEL
jgi:hypothetical protein